MGAWVCRNRNFGFSNTGSDFGGRLGDFKNIFVSNIGSVLVERLGNKYNVNDRRMNLLKLKL